MILTLAALAVVLAQATPVPDVISGGAGWVGAGLLGGVLSWLLFIHLPAKDKQIAGLIESRDLMVEKLTNSFRQGIVESEERATLVDRERREDYRANLATVVSHCEKEIGTTISSTRQTLDEINRTLSEVRGVLKELRDRKQGGGP